MKIKTLTETGEPLNLTKKNRGQFILTKTIKKYDEITYYYRPSKNTIWTQKDLFECNLDEFRAREERRTREEGRTRNTNTNPEHSVQSSKNEVRIWDYLRQMGDFNEDISIEKRCNGMDLQSSGLGTNG